MDALDGGEYSETNCIFIAINQTIHCDSIAHIKTLASPQEGLPKEFERYVIIRILMIERIWEELWTLQEKFQPYRNSERYRVDSILADPSTSYNTVGINYFYIFYFLMLLIFISLLLKHILKISLKNQITDKVETAMFKLPTCCSTDTIIILDYYLDEADYALSLPQKLSVIIIAVWKNPSEDVKMDRWMYNAYKEAEQVGHRQYIVDFDIT